MQTSSPLFFEKDEIDYGYWISRYWQLMTTKQHSCEDVYFLSTPVKVDEPYRTGRFLIPRTMAILTTPIQYITAMETKKMNKEKIFQKCKDAMSVIENMNIFLDSELVSQYCIRASSPYFTIDKKYTAMSDGYWLFIKSNCLVIGKHRINSLSSCSSGRTQITCDYMMDINE